jgi:2-hydroxy-3-keto-5-methylthiopentenyl-1-phosphate phosphatase
MRLLAPTVWKARVKRIIFCDFDGTITQTETFVAMLRHFTPELSAQLLPEIYAKRLTLREGVRRLVESIPSVRYAEILSFTQSQPLRAGLLEFLDFLETEQIPFVVISGGLRGMVESVLDPLMRYVHAIHAMDVDTRGVNLRVYSHYESGTELVAKAQIMAEYCADEAIAIGDSITDLNLALAAPIVFARPPLTRYLDEQAKPYIFWDDFFEVRDHLKAYFAKSCS